MTLLSLLPSMKVQVGFWVTFLRAFLVDSCGVSAPYKALGIWIGAFTRSQVRPEQDEVRRGAKSAAENIQCFSSLLATP